MLEAVSRACSSSFAGWRRSGGVILPVGDAGDATLTSTAEGMAEGGCLSSEGATRVSEKDRRWQAAKARGMNLLDGDSWDNSRVK